MKIPAFIIAVFCTAQLFGQPDKIGIIEVYGQSAIPETDIRKAVGLAEGDPISNGFNKKVIIDRLLGIPGVSAADVSLICCDDKQGRSMLFVGVSGSIRRLKTGQPAFKAKSVLDAYIINAYDRYEQVTREAVIAGQADENDDKGHVLLSYPPAIALQDSFETYASSHTALLQQVLGNSVYARQRQAAAWLIAFAANKKEVAGDLLHAVSDPDETVRNNATRALGVMARYAGSHPSSGIIIPAQPFIGMIHSIVWTDRNKAAMLLEALSGNRDTTVLHQIKSEALGPVTEMARWKNPGHAMFAFIILGRIAGIEEDQIFAAYTSGDRTSVVNDWLKKISAR